MTMNLEPDLITVQDIPELERIAVALETIAAFTAKLDTILTDLESADIQPPKGGMLGMMPLLLKAMR